MNFIDCAGAGAVDKVHLARQCHDVPGL